MIDPVEAAECRAGISELEHDELVSLVHKLAYQLVYIRRVANKDGVPVSVEEPLFNEVQNEAWVEAYSQY